MATLKTMADSSQCVYTAGRSSEEPALARALRDAGLPVSKPNRHERRARAAIARAKSFSFLQHGARSEED